MVDTIALTKDEFGVYCLAGTRVTLDLVVRAFNRGATAEEMARYFEKRDREEKELLASNETEWAPRGLRERLLARRNAIIRGIFRRVVAFDIVRAQDNPKISGQNDVVLLECATN